MSSETNNDTENKEKSRLKAVKISPCLRYERHEKNPENMIGAETSYLGMDLEEGTEVVWGEAHLKNISNNILDKIKHIFDRIVQFKHPNLLKYHTYWIEEVSEKNYCLYFITERVDNSILQFIKRTKNSKKPITQKTQIRYCNQILLGLSYLHSLNPPFHFSYFGCDTVLITHDGSIKIAPVFPSSKLSIINCEITKCTETNQTEEEIGIKIMARNIHDFGCIVYALATLDYSTQDILGLKTENQEASSSFGLLSTEHKDLITTCLKDSDSVTILSLLKHKLLFEFPTLKLISGHACVRYGTDITKLNPDDFPTAKIFATLANPSSKNVLYSDIPSLDVKKYITYIMDGFYPLTGITQSEHILKSSEMSINSSKNSTPNITIPIDLTHTADNDKKDINDGAPNGILNNTDKQPVIAIQCRLSKKPVENNDTLSPWANDRKDFKLTIVLFYRKHASRHIETDISSSQDTGQSLTEDLIHNKLASEKTRSVLSETIDRALKGEQVVVTSAYCK